MLGGVVSGNHQGNVSGVHQFNADSDLVTVPGIGPKWKTGPNKAIITLNVNDLNQ